MSAHRHAKITILQPTHAGLKPTESSPVGPHWGGGGSWKSGDSTRDPVVGFGGSMKRNEVEWGLGPHRRTVAALGHPKSQHQQFRGCSGGSRYMGIPQCHTRGHRGNGGCTQPSRATHRHTPPRTAKHWHKQIYTATPTQRSAHSQSHSNRLPHSHAATHTYTATHTHTHTHDSSETNRQTDRVLHWSLTNLVRPYTHQDPHTHTHTHTLIPHMQTPPMPRRVPLALTKPLPPSIHTPGAGSSSSRSLHATLASSMYLRSHVKTTSATHPS